MSFPENDNQFEEYSITNVERSKGTFTIFNGSWGLWCGNDCPITPKVGMVARQYGRGIGAQVRGLFIDGVKVWYRTDAEQKEHSEVQLYGADAADWLARWDAGRSVWSIEMGGIGPGYEQCIQITAAENLRWLLAEKPDHSKWSDPEVWRADRDRMELAGFANPIIDGLGLSGAQWGAAVSLATKLYMDGPRKIMNEPKIKDRHIQVSRTFPQAA